MRLATDIEWLRRIRRELPERLRQSTVLDGPRFTRGLEQAYREMVEKAARQPGRAGVPLARPPGG